MNRAADDPEGLAEDLEEMAAEDPWGYSQLLVSLARAEAEAQFAQQFQQQVAPIIDHHNDQVASQAIAELRAEFGEDVLEAHKATLAEAIQRNPAQFMDPKTRVDSLKTLMRAELYRQGQEQAQAYARGDDVKADMQPLRRDAYGQIPNPLGPIQEEEGAWNAHSRDYGKSDAEIIAEIDNAHPARSRLHT